MRKFLAFFAIVSLFLFLFVAHPWADELDDITHQLDSLKADLKNKEANFDKLNKQIEGIKARVSYLGGAIQKKEREVIDGEKALSHQRDLLDQRAESYYKNISKSEYSLINLFASPNLSTSLGNFFYQKSLTNRDKNEIIKIVLFIKDLETKKAELISEKSRLAVIKVEVDKQSTALAGEISGVQQKVAQLSAQQQSLIAAKQASLNIPKSAGTSAKGCSSDLTNGKDPGFSPRLGFFTYGVPNRVGLNQYGAWGRAKAGQSTEDILAAYYPDLTLKKDYDQGATIVVDGTPYNVEDYVKRIYEMPDSWTDNGSAALKAQAVAARSYGLAHRGGICSTDSCQVFHPDPKGGNWNQAAEDTKGWVLVDGSGNPASTQYSSTHGGYILNLNKFDGPGGAGSFADINNNSYDKESPWFYCDWGSRSDHGGTAWLQPSEVADIANIIMLARRDSGTTNHLYQPDRPNPAGTDTWDPGKVRAELGARGGNPYNNVSDVSVGVDFGSGRTTSVNVSGDAGSNSFDAAEFKNWFNLRAPANVQIVGPLFNVEKR